jgi:Transposase IS66 family
MLARAQDDRVDDKAVLVDQAGLDQRPGEPCPAVGEQVPVRAEVTEHQLIERECGCGQHTRAAVPPGAGAPACYGPRAAAVIIFLYAGQFLSKQRTAQALAELFGITLSPGTVAALTARAAGKLGGFLEFVREQIARSAVAGSDETGFRVDGRLAWVHCARTGKYTLFTVHPTSFAVPMPCGNCKPSPMPRPRANGAGPPRPLTRSPRCRRWSARRSARAAAPQTQTPLAAQIHAYRSAAVIGARQCAIRSYLPTAAKHDLTFFDALAMLTSGQPWMPAIE